MTDPVTRWGESHPGGFSAYVGAMVAVIASGFTVVGLVRFQALSEAIGGPMIGIVFVIIMALIGGGMGILLLRPFIERLQGERERWHRIAQENPGQEHADLADDDGGVHKVQGGVEIYQSTLMHIWEDGVVTDKEARTLKDLRARLGVSETQHRHLEKEVVDVLFDGKVPRQDG